MAEGWIFFIKDVVLGAKNPAVSVAFSGFNRPKLVLKLRVRSCCKEPAGRFESSHEILTSNALLTEKVKQGEQKK